MRPGRSASPSPPPVDITYYQEFSRSLKNDYPDFHIDLKERNVSGIEQALKDGIADHGYLRCLLLVDPELEYLPY